LAARAERSARSLVTKMCRQLEFVLGQFTDTDPLQQQPSPRLEIAVSGVTFEVS
jgi:hypothetical protein